MVATEETKITEVIYEEMNSNYSIDITAEIFLRISSLLYISFKPNIFKKEMSTTSYENIKLPCLSKNHRLNFTR